MKKLYIVFLIFFPTLVLAADVTTVLSNLLDYLTGTWGKIVSALAIVGIGYACFFLGKVHKSYVVTVVVGIGLVFGAQEILNHITG